jgi:chromosome segregation ATPase
MGRNKHLRDQVRGQAKPKAEPETEELDPLDALNGDMEPEEEIEDLHAEEPESEAEVEGDDPLSALKKQYEAIQAEKKAIEDRLKEREAADARAKSEADEHRRGREDAEKRLRDEQKRREEAEEHRFKAEKETLVGHKSVLEHAIAASKADIENAKRAYAAALTDMDYAAAADAQEKLTEAKYQVTKLTEGYEQLEERINAPAPAREQPKQERQAEPQGDPWEAAIANYSEGDKQWLRAHRDDLANPSRQQLAQAADTTAVAKYNLKRGTDEYYSFLDEFMGYADPSEGDADPEPEQVPQKPAAKPRSPVLPSAPVSRANTNNGSQAQAYLTPEEKATARDLGMSFAKYAQWKDNIAKGKTHLRFQHEGN